MGSFMFAAITFQIIAYYLIGIIFLILGYGHIKLRNWIKSYSVILLKFWLIIGLPLIAVVIAFTAMTKRLSIFSGIILIGALFLLYFVIPFFLLRFYKGNQIEQMLNLNKKTTHWLNRFPERILIIVLLYIFFGFCLHIPIFFRGLFPFFGNLLSNFEGIVGVVFTLIILIILILGTLKQKVWAWWGSILFFMILIVTLIMTFMSNSYSNMLARLKLPTTELNVFQRLPLQGFHIIIFFGIPSVAIGILVYKSKRYFH